MKFDQVRVAFDRDFTFRPSGGVRDFRIDLLDPSRTHVGIGIAEYRVEATLDEILQSDEPIRNDVPFEMFPMRTNP